MRWSLVIAAAVVASVALAAGAAAAASPNASLSETINVGVRSLTVSPTSVSVCSLAAPLTSPNGVCRSPLVTITNGPVGGHVDVAGANAVPSDGSGNGWSLCREFAHGCSGPPDPFHSTFALPGVDQYESLVGQVTATANAGVELGTTPECDQSWNPPSFSCAVSAGEVGNEEIVLQGPTSSTDQSPTFTTSVTWTAVP